MPYDRANEAMHALAERRLAGEIPDTVILLEHPPVFTAGRRAKDDELLWDETSVEARGGLVRRIDRGGSFTFHGPGQLVGYPILGLGTKPDAGAYLRRLEEVVIRTCADLGATVDAPRRRPDRRVGGRREDLRDRRPAAADARHAARVRPQLRHRPVVVRRHRRLRAARPRRDLAHALLGRDVTVDEVRPLLDRHLADDVRRSRSSPAPGRRRVGASDRLSAARRR